MPAVEIIADPAPLNLYRQFPFTATPMPLEELRQAGLLTMTASDEAPPPPDNPLRVEP